ncbi:Fic family protein [Collinsella aerofaciens]|uniref:Adenosine monophosphate-protein transferase SoFic n=1 Tax=Collinsella aerofaciens TaxID=74426 RepID=A0A5K1IN15_9ACTN|nr:Fic family protein [Collinsella aerofaciens]VWL89689.1 Adenosine monophosphate-protein transferase SoFic [Collinsella aerofaciens]
MQIEENGQGTLRNNLSGKLAYYSFFPTPLQSLRQLNLTEETYRTLSACSRKLGELEGMLYFVPNADMYLTMYARKEALLSSQIEGTQCTFDDLLSPSQTQLHHKDVADVVNYVRAVARGVELLKKMPLCTRLLRQVHAVLLDGVRGTEKNPGELRSSQNWIGPSGCTIATASFVPPNIEDLSNTLQDLERFINEPQVEMDPIVRAALVHYQFETAHPFLDGNGRLGRLLITLMLINDGVLHSCLFYPSFQFKKNRSEYYRQLTSVRERGTYEEWIEFFCNSLLESAKDSVGSLKNLVDLHNRSTATITENLGRTAANGQRLLGILEEHPIVDTAFIAAQLDIGRSTASSLVKSFEELGILRPLDESRQRYRQYGYEEYLSILREDAEPIR